MALIADFDSEDDRHSYTDHHQAFTRDVAPIVAEAVRVQYEVS